MHSELRNASTLVKVQSKILSPEHLKQWLGRWRLLGKKIVFTNGCFDLLHLGHIDYLSKAADEGDILIVGINGDDSVKRLKGQRRPINSEQQRATIIAALHFVDAVVVFHEDTPYELIKIVEPDVLIKGADYKAEDIVGYDVVSQKGGIVKTVDLLEGYSTTAIEERIRNMN